MGCIYLDIILALALGIFLALLERFLDDWIATSVFWLSMLAFVFFIARRGWRYGRRH